jgi:hypothetical protein
MWAGLWGGGGGMRKDLLPQQFFNILKEIFQEKFLNIMILKFFKNL